MKIAVIAANGKQGQLLVKEAISKGHDVTAIVRSDNKSEASKFVIKDLFDLNYDDLKDFDVIIDAFGSWGNDAYELHQTSLAHLVKVLDGKPNRLLVVGGAGSLYIDDKKTMLMDAPDFPAEYRPTAEAMAKGLDILRKSSNLNWTYLSPAADFVADGAKTGKYKLGGENMILNDKNESKISYADFATAMVAEAENNLHNRERISVIAE